MNKYYFLPFGLEYGTTDLKILQNELVGLSITKPAYNQYLVIHHTLSYPVFIFNPETQCYTKKFYFTETPLDYSWLKDSTKQLYREFLK